MAQKLLTNPKSGRSSQPANTPAPGDNPRPASFRTVPVQERSLWQSYAVLPARTRLHISLGITAFALAGILMSNQLEKILPPSKEDAARLAEGTPKEAPPP
ncbi:hypothetical protein SCP_0100950 [Sparassis crispa]|uniref:Uncharacterized protein n=1 Tax=Sparassis crispa TaxID=139825 RepID=A0A401G4Y4_9APHY|nr:hypothetical protein SCP_0100950 [Sparassis crispa]GBE77223.1 hypothetical protein SCP_0100950 [Sparassis crispa]